MGLMHGGEWAGRTYEGHNNAHTMLQLSVDSTETHLVLGNKDKLVSPFLTSPLMKNRKKIGSIVTVLKILATIIKREFSKFWRAILYSISKFWRAQNCKI